MVCFLTHFYRAHSLAEDLCIFLSLFIFEPQIYDSIGMSTVSFSAVRNKSFSCRATLEITGSPSIYNTLLEFLLKARYQ